ncbi:Uu.00g053480.m01.CDS01 [Anthostomella pinea]|uniref:ASTRA-associated protein 1 n=1 Tax=Anthostomella pinea TaxID=933095 RepID=A0AAI8YPH8_9PEZI|nr:Uu.00g053480.m01.CDS01 [Anthostomella pinea]
MSQQPTAQPKSVLRGHRAQVHTTAFVRRNQRLASGDADGFVVLWDLTIMRPRAVWRAHTNAILGISDWGDDKLITEGRDNRLIVWKITAEDEAALSIALPLDEAAPERPQPWVVHILEINTMNFCSFASCAARSDVASEEELLVAVPNTLASEAVDIYQLPSQKRQHTVHLGSKAEQKGMVMALRLFWHHHGSLVLVAGYENGLAIVAQRRCGGSWDVVYKTQAHSQPVISLDVAPGREYFLTSSADAVIAKHPIPNAGAPEVSVTTTETRTTEKTAGMGQESGADPSLLSAGFGSSSTPTSESYVSASASGTRPPKKTVLPVETQPLKTVNTKHAGQQDLRIRSDGKIFATAGWDSKVRVYSAKTMAELAVLKWHDVGCYAVAFAALEDANNTTACGKAEEYQNAEGRGESEEGSAAVATTTASKGKETAMTAMSNKLGDLSVKDRRIKLAKEAHWLAAGSKDGKISLWDVY